ncbi:MAG: signal peptidase I [Candidatus Riflebacteria bacterium]|nr:signal peptidase I [Candidatus Riflebacteria bacterium]
MSSGGGSGDAFFALIQLAIGLICLVSMWTVFTKAGQPGWACIVPIYNLYVMLIIGGKPGWWLLLLFVPLVNLIIMFMMIAGIAANFGKGLGYVLGLIFLPFIFYPLLAFGDAEYVGSKDF